MFGASVSELYLLNKLLINIEDSRRCTEVMEMAWADDSTLGMRCTTQKLGQAS